MVLPLRNERGEIELCASISRDISDLRRSAQTILDLNASLERRVAERTAQLVKATQARSAFLANMSHELRTPLNAIVGFSEMLKDGLLGELTSKQHGPVSHVFDAGVHLLALIDEVLDLSKVEAGKMQLELDMIDVSALIESCVEIVGSQAQARRIVMITRAHARLGSLVADERKLKQILFNLLSNAVKFSPEGSTVTLGARRCRRAEVVLDGAAPGRLIPLAPGADDEFLAISVEDQGMGIAPEQMNQLFEPFVQVDNSASRQQRGTGLGLSLMRRLVELHGGTVGLVSRVGAGSCFSVWLPWRDSAPQASAPAVLVQANDAEVQTG